MRLAIGFVSIFLTVTLTLAEQAEQRFEERFRLSYGRAPFDVRISQDYFDRIGRDPVLIPFETVLGRIYPVVSVHSVSGIRWVKLRDTQTGVSATLPEGEINWVDRGAVSIRNVQANRSLNFTLTRQNRQTYRVEAVHRESPSLLLVEVLDPGSRTHRWMPSYQLEMLP